MSSVSGPSGYISPEGLLAWADSIEQDLYGQMKGHMDSAQAAVTKMGEAKKAKAGADGDAAKAEKDASIDQASHDQQMAMIQVQELNSKINSIKQFTSNVLASWERTDNAIIGNMRG
jgi:hypothetical protein